MKQKLNQLLVLLALMIMTLIVVTSVQAQEKLDTRIGRLSFTHDFASGYPTDKTIAKLFDEIDFQRACQAIGCSSFRNSPSRRMCSSLSTRP